MKKVNNLFNAGYGWGRTYPLKTRLIKKLITWDSLPNGVYAVSKEGLPVMPEDADESCIAVALIVNDAPVPLKFMIEKNPSKNEKSINKAYMIDDTDINMSYFRYGYFSSVFSSDYETSLIDAIHIDNYRDGSIYYYHGTDYSPYPKVSLDYKTWKSKNLVYCDFDGKNNTKALLKCPKTDRDYANLTTYLEIFNSTAEENQGYLDWYIPSMGQLGLIYLNFNEIKTLINKINGSIDNAYFYSSTEFIGASSFSSGETKYRSYSYWINLNTGNSGYSDGNAYILFIRDIIDVKDQYKQSYGDVVYWDGSKVKTASYDTWSSLLLGTPIGVVVVPEGFASDNHTRFIALNAVDRDGNISKEECTIEWGPKNDDTVLNNATTVPITDNLYYYSTSSNGSGYFPSDYFDGVPSLVDNKVAYCDYTNTNFIPSPYLTINSTERPNTDYFKESLKDFNGLGNTETLVNLGPQYVSANVCWKYSDACSTTLYYLPTIGELGYLIARFTKINETLIKLGGTALNNTCYYSSSTELNANFFVYLSTHYGYIPTWGANFKNSDWQFRVRPFGMI